MFTPEERDRRRKDLLESAPKTQSIFYDVGSEFSLRRRYPSYVYPEVGNHLGNLLNQ